MVCNAVRDIHKQDPKEYIEEHQTEKDYDGALYGIDPSLLTGGHGGKLEEDFASTVRSRQDYKDLPKALFGRYQGPVMAQYASYDEYLNASMKDLLNDEAGKVKAGDETAMRHAARMLIAFELKNKGKAYNQKYFDQKTVEVYNSPQFRFIAKHDPQKLNLLSTGNFTAYAESLNHYTDEANQSDQDDPQRGFERKNTMFRILGNLKTGTPYGTVAERKEYEDHIHIKEMLNNSYEFLGHKASDEPTPLKNMRYATKGLTPEEGARADKYPVKEKTSLEEEDVSRLYTFSKEGLFEGFKADKNALQNAQHVNEQNVQIRRPLG